MRLAKAAFAAAGLLLLGTTSTGAQTAPDGSWISGYLASWTQKSAAGGKLDAKDIDFDAVTHLIHFALIPRSDGTLNYDSLSAERRRTAVAAAHAHGRPILLSVGGWGAYDGFRAAIRPAARAAFVANLVGAMTADGYDGLDLDFEPIQTDDVPYFEAFVAELHDALQPRTTPLLSRPLLTAAVSWQPAMFARLRDRFDQINIMTYDLSGTWPGWVTWHNAPVYDGGNRFPSTGGLVPSADGEVGRFAAAGVPLAKLGIGAAFYGYVWSGGAGTSTGGATRPMQTWTTAPAMSALSFDTIMGTYWQSDRYRWDAGAQAAYLSIDAAGSADDKFITYDDETSCRMKMEFARDRGLGGLIVWELAAGWRPSQPAGSRDPLLQALKAARNAGTGDAVAPVATITAPTTSGAWTAVSPEISLGGVASDNVGIVRIAWANAATGASGDAVGTTSWSATVPLAPGDNAIVVAAWDAAGNRGTASIAATYTPPADAEPPTVAIVSPAAGTWIKGNGTVSVLVNAADNVGVTRVELYVDGVRTGMSTTAPFTTTFRARGLAKGAHTLMCRAYDAAGNRGDAPSVTVYR